MRFLEWLKRVVQIFKRDDVKNKIGVAVSVSREMADALKIWSELYVGKAPWLSDDVKSLNIPAAVASDMARLITAEMKSDISGSSRADYLNEVYQLVLSGMRAYVEYGCAKSGLAFKPYVTDKGLQVGFIQADCFFPTAFSSSGKITGAVFVDQINRDKRYYTRLEYHNMGESYSIKNRAFVSHYASEIGREISLESVEEWQGLEAEISIENIDRPLFGYFKFPGANTVDSSSPLGVSVYAKAIDLIKEADKQYSRLLWEFESGERALFVSDTAFKKGRDGKPILPHKRLYRTLSLEFDGEDLYKEWTPTLREENILHGLNAILRKIEYTCGLAYGTLSDVQDTDKTAEEIRASKQRSYTTVCDAQKALRTALEDLVYSMDVLCSLYKLSPAGSYDVSFEFDDSIVADRQAEFAEKQQLVTAGIMQPWEFRMWYFGETEEEAKRATGGETAAGGAGDRFQIVDA